MRIVLVTRHYPPAVSGGVRRPYFLAHALAEAGAEVFVVAPDADPELSGIGVPHPHRDPPAAAAPGGMRDDARSALRDTLRNWWYWPDPDIRWARRAVLRTCEEIPFAPDWVLTTSSPESIHWAGRALKQRLGCRWSADFRDHWFERAFRLNRRQPLRRSLESVYARRLLGALDFASSVNEAIDGEVARLTGLPPARRMLLPHFSPPLPPPLSFSGPGPHLLHAGSFSLSDPDCSIVPTLSAFESAWRRRPSLVLHLVGRLSPAERSAIVACPAASGITVHGIVPLRVSLAMQQAADALIIAAAPTADTPPGKYAEYLAVHRPVIAVGAGPWRGAIGLEGQDPVAAMAAADGLAPASAAAPLSAREAAGMLLARLREVP